VEKGSVIAVNQRRLVVVIDGDSCAAFELGGDYDVQVGHRLRGSLESDLCFALENLTTGEMFDVVPLGQYASVDEAKRAIGL
jgi:hypothetical protein